MIASDGDPWQPWSAADRRRDAPVFGLFHRRLECIEIQIVASPQQILDRAKAAAQVGLPEDPYPRRSVSCSGSGRPDRGRGSSGYAMSPGDINRILGGRSRSLSDGRAVGGELAGEDRGVVDLRAVWRIKIVSLMIVPIGTRSHLASAIRLTCELKSSRSGKVAVAPSVSPISST